MTEGRESSLCQERDLLERAELRLVRLQIEYLGAELGLSDHGIRHSIVVFGGTRLLDPDIARDRLAAAEEAVARAGGSSDAGGAEADAAVGLRRACRALEQSRYYAIGREFGRIVGRHEQGPEDNRVVIVTGGGPGGMEAANRGAHDVGAASVGLNITLPHEQQPNPYVTPELCFSFRYFALRKLHFMMRARAFVALPGGYGTFDELFETLCLIQTGKREPLPVVLVGEEFWRRAVDFDYLVEEEMIGPRELELFSFAESAQEAWDAIVRWYTDRGESLIDERSHMEDAP